MVMKQYPNLIQFPNSVEGESPIFRSIEVFKPVENGISTLYELLLDSIKQMPNVMSFGQRRVIRVHTQEKAVETIVDGVKKTVTKTFEMKELSPFEYISYEEMGQLMHQIGSGLVQSGLKSNQRIGLFAPTSRFWKLVAFGACSQSIEMVTIYDTLGADGLKHAIEEGEITHLFTSATLFPVISQIVSQVSTLNTIIYHDTCDEKLKLKLLEIRNDIQLIELDQLIKLGIANPVDPNPPKSDDTACIMYTSGSTGNPKGVVITHKNIISVVGAMKQLTVDWIHAGDLVLNYLPFAHIFSFMVDIFATHHGVILAYGSPRTLIDTMVTNCKGDLTEFRPTLLFGVPQVFDSIRKSALNKLAGAGIYAQILFEYLLSFKQTLRDWNIPSAFLDVLFNKLRGLLGGRVKIAVVGGAPISNQTFNFVSNVFCPVSQAYGMTEICGYAFSSMKIWNQLGQVGYPSSSIEFKLVDIPEMGYLSTNENPQGEVWFRGDNVACGYFKQPQVTAEAFTEDGWLLSGDIGQINPDGTLSIIDRKKNLVKLPNGEYIAIEKLESIYKTNLLADMVCVVVDQNKPKPIIVVVPNLEAVQRLAVGNNVTDPIDTLSQIIKSTSLNKLILNELIKTGSGEGLKGGELVSGLILSEENWTPENGMLTAAQKLKRKAVEAKYREDISDRFSKM